MFIFTLKGGYTLPAGLSVCVLIYGMHHSPAVYTDPDAFKPERFIPENSTGRHPFAFIPFSAGLRNCIGQKYGLFELKVVLSTLIRRFRFSMDEATKVRTVASSEIVLKPVNGIRLILTPRV
jgi:cytochrome P450 family 4